MNLDRSGNARYEGYRQQDFQLCKQCEQTGLRTDCRLCGGYGEYPKSTDRNSKEES